MKTFQAMETAFYKDVRWELLNGLAQCTEENHHRFKLMYANGHMNWSIEKTVANMPRSKLDWAMQQVQRTIDKQ